MAISLCTSHPYLKLAHASVNYPNLSGLIGPVLLGQTGVVRIFPGLLGCAEEDLDEAPTLGRLQDEIPMYKITRRLLCKLTAYAKDMSRLKECAP